MLEAMEFLLNGKKVRVEAEESRSLLDILREDFDLTGAKYGCGEGQCGACTVLIDGKAVRSCITRAANISGKQITTIEGLEQQNGLHPLQKAFVEAGAMQCGYCIPGMLMSAAGLLKKTPQPSEADILSAMEGNMCRCGTYPRIVAAIKSAAAGEKVAKGGSR